MSITARTLLKTMSARDARFYLSSVQAALLAMEPREEAVMDPEDLAPMFHAVIGTLPEERFAAAFVTQARNLVGPIKVFEGGSISRTVLYPRVLFKEAFNRDATGIIICHNHPGGTPLPSPQDRELTRRVQELGDSLECRLLDHLIVTPKGGHASFRRHGWMS